MENLIKIHRNLNEIDFKPIWKEGLFVFDSNVLLDLYRLPVTARGDLIRVFENKNFNKRIWIGFQVILEFLNNRLEVISDQKNKFFQVKSLTEETIKQYGEIIEKLKGELNKLKLKKRHSLIDPEKFINSKKVDEGSQFLKEFISHLNELELQQFDVNESDDIKGMVLNIFNGKIGQPFENKVLQELYIEGESRYKRRIPPGYMDEKKEGFYLYEDKEFIRKFGDLILWNEIIEKCKKDKTKYLVLVTGDVKEDWWQEKRGKKLGARSELLNEIYLKLPELEVFYLYDTSTFLKYAQKELDKNIKDSSIDEAKELIEVSKQNRTKASNESFVNFPITSLDDLRSKLIEITNKTKTYQGLLSQKENELRELSKYRSELNNNSDNDPNLQDHAHNLGYLEFGLEEEKQEIMDALIKLSDLRKILIIEYSKLSSK